MSKAESFKKAYKQIIGYAGENYMAKPENWCVVHATKYLPQKHQDGKMYIPSTAMATNFDIPRNTVHTTFNHIVRGHMMGNWDDSHIVILTPYTDIVKKNGNPVQVSGVDTYWSVDPTKGLVLSDNTFIVQPSNDVLYSINEHGATYKRDNFTEEEIQTIISMLSPSELETYNKYKNADFESYEIEHEFDSDKRVKKMYESAKDKKAFLRGLFEESRFDILSHFLRDAVVRMSMEKMGFVETNELSDGSPANTAIAETAVNMGLHATASNKGHSSSLYADMENFWGHIRTCFYGGFDKYGLLNAPDLEELVVFIANNIHNPAMISIIKNLLENKPVDFAKLYEDSFLISIKGRKFWTNYGIENQNDEIRYINNYQIPESEKDERRAECRHRIQEYKQEIAYYDSIKNISDYDPYLAETIKKNAVILSAQFNEWYEKLKQSDDYQSFMNHIRQIYNSVSVQNVVDNER
jgi:hypothetical protein